MCRLVLDQRCITKRGATHSGLTKCRCAIVRLEVELGATIAVEAMVPRTAAAFSLSHRRAFVREAAIPTDIILI